AGVEVHAEPVALHGADQPEEFVHRCRDAAMVLQGQIYPKLGGMFARFLDGFYALLAGTLVIVAALEAAGENAHRFAAETARVLRPLLHHVDLGAQLGRVAQTEVVADRSAADVETESSALPFETSKVRGGRFREIVSRELDRVEGLSSSVVD